MERPASAAALRQARKRRKEPPKPDLPPSWLHASQVLDKAAPQLGGEMHAKEVLATAVREGRVNVFTNFLREITTSDEWGASSKGVPFEAAVQRGYSLSAGAGPIPGSFALSKSFWDMARDFTGDVQLWNWSSGEFFLGRALPQSDRNSTRCWELRHPFFLDIEIEALLLWHRLQSVRPMTQADEVDTGGRPRRPQWTDWTAEAVLYFFEEGFDLPEKANLGKEASVIAKELDDRLAHRGVPYVDRRSAKAILVKILERGIEVHGKPRKS